MVAKDVARAAPRELSVIAARDRLPLKRPAEKTSALAQQRSQFHLLSPLQSVRPPRPQRAWGFPPHAPSGIPTRLGHASPRWATHGALLRGVRDRPRPTLARAQPTPARSS